MDPEILERILIELTKSYRAVLGDGLERIYLYGSQARGEARAGSDIDILVVMRREFNYATALESVLEITASISLENDVVISPVFVTKSRFEAELSPFLMNVRREAVPV